MNTETRRSLLKLVQDGHDAEAAAVSLGVPISEITKAGPQLKAALAESLIIGNAKLRGRIMQLALAGSDVRALGDMLVRREKQAEPEPTRVVRVIVPAICENCGAKARINGDRVLEPADKSESVEPEPAPVKLKPSYSSPTGFKEVIN